jgi:hypothetical protein
MGDPANILGQPSYDQRPAWPATDGSGAESNHAGPASDPIRSTPFARSQTARRDVASERQLDPPSLSARPPATTGTAVHSSRQQVAAQPLFNGLLLISFVANIYLIFWLKNLRIQFRDLVAAKRIANSNHAQ